MFSELFEMTLKLFSTFEGRGEEVDLRNQDLELDLEIFFLDFYFCFCITIFLLLSVFFEDGDLWILSRV